MLSNFIAPGNTIIIGVESTLNVTFMGQKGPINIYDVMDDPSIYLTSLAFDNLLKVK